MPIEVRGNHLRVRIKTPMKNARYRTDDIGSKGHTQRIAMYNPKTKRWSTQSWIFPVKDVKMRREKTFKILRRLGVATEARRLIK